MDSRCIEMKIRTDLKTPTLPQRLRYNKGQVQTNGYVCRQLLLFRKAGVVGESVAGVGAWRWVVAA